MADDATPPALQLAPGDLCHHGANALPLYRVIWIDGDRAWLRDVNTDQDAVVTLGKCRPCLEEPEPDVPKPSGPMQPDGTPWP